MGMETLKGHKRFFDQWMGLSSYIVHFSPIPFATYLLLIKDYRNCLNHWEMKAVFCLIPLIFDLLEELFLNTNLTRELALDE